jgi:hypothetical protein
LTDTDLQRHGLPYSGASTAAPFVQALDRFHRPVAIDWGFPPERLNTVRKLFDGGVMLWWFAADWRRRETQI